MKREPTDAISLLDRMIGTDVGHRKGIAVEVLNDEVVDAIYAAREAAGMDPVPDDLDFRTLTVTQLAELLWELGVGLKLQLTPLEHLARNEQAPAIPSSKKQRKTG